MVGIAGRVPLPEKPNERVRLGDIVVSNKKGVIQYDFTKNEIKENEAWRETKKWLAIRIWNSKDDLKEQLISPFPAGFC
jgi:hypothetical protein